MRFWLFESLFDVVDTPVAGVLIAGIAVTDDCWSAQFGTLLLDGPVGRAWRDAVAGSTLSLLW